jgi:integrase
MCSTAATINARKGLDANNKPVTIGWQAIIRMRGHPSQTRTFRTKRDAEAWAKVGGSCEVPLSHAALQILHALSGNAKATGPVWKAMATHSFSQTFIRACDRANLEDLKLHDLRHEATSRFFEKGLNPMQVSAITGHKTLQMLKRYTHLRAEDLAKLLG